MRRFLISFGVLLTVLNIVAYYFIHSLPPTYGAIQLLLIGVGLIALLAGVTMRPRVTTNGTRKE